MQAAFMPEIFSGLLRTEFHDGITLEDLMVALAGCPRFRFWDLENYNLPPPLAQNYVLPAHNGDRKSHERSRRRGGSCAHVSESISQEPARSVPSPSNDLINTPTPSIYFQILADNF
jgi:hypothetical protein